MGLEPIAYWLRVSCATICAMKAIMKVDNPTRTGSRGVAVHCLTIWLYRHIYDSVSYFFCGGNFNKMISLQRCWTNPPSDPCGTWTHHYHLERVVSWPLDQGTVSSKSGTRTHNPTVNSRVLYHWAIKE